MEQGMDENIHDYFSQIDKLVNEMKFNSDDIKETKVIEKIMCIFSPIFYFVVATIKE